ncbi:MAG: 50S ribosomal protein L28 [Fusobacteria bacterium]|nr:50S ribosomal protein L28 [Fusobacteriota bacterium]
MAKCEICGKGQMSGNNVSHSHVKTKRKWNPNLQAVKANVLGSAKKINVCTRCLRSGKVERA